MDYFEIDESDITYFQNEINQIVKKLYALNDSELLKPKIDELIKFRDELALNLIFNESAYLDLSKRLINSILSFQKSNGLWELVLSFSRINSSIREVYEELDLISDLVEFIGNNWYETTDYNEVFVQDLQYSYFYYKSVELKKNEGIEKLIDFLNKDYKLLKNSNRIWITRSIIETFIKAKILNNQEVSFLQESLDNRIANNIKWNL